MKLLFFFALTFCMVLPISALDTRSSEFIDYLLRLKTPAAPEIFEDAVVFTASSIYKKVGVAFASENFSKIHWFSKLLVPIDDTVTFDPKSKIPPEMLRDSGLLFYAWMPEQRSVTIEYRLIIDGLWCADPLNRERKVDPYTGLELSVTAAPAFPQEIPREEGVLTSLTLSYRAERGEIITVAGDFNGWDPFMYQLKESAPGFYTISLPLPPGRWRYVFFHRGQRVLDPANLDKVYAKNGMTANSIVLK
ncbi:MAG: isoamylase [Spirochaetaceae bacterium]|jgi:hypothetical protein|nr:isoamylase [Spirochaetaceae bacterium]